MNCTGYLQGRESIWGSWGTPPSLLDLENRQKWVGNLESQPLHPQGNGTVDRSQGSDWANWTWLIFQGCTVTVRVMDLMFLQQQLVDWWIIAIVPEKLSSSSVLVRVYQSTGCNIPENLNVHCEMLIWSLWQWGSTHEPRSARLLLHSSTLYNSFDMFHKWDQLIWLDTDVSVTQFLTNWH
jgi:hypothetical protein